MKKSLGLWIEEKLSHLILASLVLGFILGMSFPDASPYIAPVGDIFIRLMKMLILPLVFASIVDGVLSLKDTNDLSRMGSRTIGYYMGTTFLATLTGILVVNIIQPGVGFVESAATTQAPPEVKAFTFITFFENLIPINPFKVLAEGKVLPVIFFAISFALCILISREKSIVPKPDPLTAVFKRSFEAMMVMTKFVILLSPIGLFALIYKVEPLLVFLF